jgi:hypothetical protein
MWAVGSWARHLSAPLNYTRQVFVMLPIKWLGTLIDRWQHAATIALKQVSASLRVWDQSAAVRPVLPTPNFNTTSVILFLVTLTGVSKLPPGVTILRERNGVNSVNVNRTPSDCNYECVGHQTIWRIWIKFGIMNLCWKFRAASCPSRRCINVLAGHSGRWGTHILEANSFCSFVHIVTIRWTQQCKYNCFPEWRFSSQYPEMSCY